MNETAETWYDLFFKCLVEFTSGATWVWYFLFWKVTSYWFKFFKTDIGLIQIICFSCVSFGKQLIYFIYVIKFAGTELFIVFLYYPLNVHTICSDVPAFISDISILYWFLSFFFFFGLARVIDFTVFFQRTNFGFTNFFSIDFLI